jgi:mono/diheme cytochrome c family protein
MTIRSLTLGLAASTLLASTFLAGAAHAQFRFTYPDQGGEAIYKNICQGCHMPDAKGAAGAGVYPALATNGKLAARGYPIQVVMNGQKAMPEFGSSLSDAQIADVVTYIRTSFGNKFAGAVTADQVKALRPAPKVVEAIKPPG